ncbi:hypothetical protein D7W79_18615 [Corallococcus exercitus]|uniref:Uncharacterized protein n=1 Tax=Corallococcus exercitus TaxID=2316736 RepID=A0A3A8HY89_9BACT|nr:hypothetical protein [Corallococcus exercitus]NOK32785.1 hypothetical protein [Corallococcus exercitus]RKG76127.1 hypothetical protein D7W79_18615 [Corallococcus exercitus]
MADASNPYHSWLSQTLTGLVSRPSQAYSAKSVAAPPLQRLEPAMEWDWAPTGDGILGAAAYHFYDSMPASSDPDALFVSTGDSFSGNYLAFLQLLRSDFQPALTLKQTLSVAQQPQSDPASSPTPRGWTKILSASNLLQWAPDWCPAKTPQDWIQDVCSQPSPPAGSLALDPRAAFGGEVAPAASSLVQARTGTGRPVPLGFQPGELLSLNLSAQAWGRVPITPGAWYSSALMMLGRSGPFVEGRTPSQVFGPTGLLRCRVAEMVLAYKPSVQMRVSPSFASRHAATLGAATGLSVGGVPIQGAVQRPAFVPRKDSGPDGVTFQSTTASQIPVIVAVMLETFSAPP